MTRTLCTVLLLCIPLAGLSAQKSGAWCKETAVSLKAPQIPIRVQAINFGSQGNESFVQLSVFNAEAKAIRHYLILIEFFDTDGGFLLTVPFYTNDQKTGETPFPISYKRWLYGHSSSAVSPLPSMAEESFFGDSATVAFECPASARLAVVQLQYVDGTTFSLTAPGLTLDPIIALASISDPTLRQWLPTFLTARLAVDAKGHAKLVAPENSPVFDLLAKEIEGWKLSPALVHGEASAAELTLLMYLEDVGQDREFTQPPAEYISRMSMLGGQGVRTLTMVHAYRWSPTAKRWIVKAGHNWVEKLDERQR